VTRRTLPSGAHTTPLADTPKTPPHKQVPEEKNKDGLYVPKGSKPVLSLAGPQVR
jgi:hypothetical protein